MVPLTPEKGIDFHSLYQKIRKKSGIPMPLVQFKDEDDEMISLEDQDDLDIALELLSISNNPQTNSKLDLYIA